MTTIVTSEKARHLVFRLEAEDVIPGALLQAMREAGVTAGWLRANGVLAEVDVRTSSAGVGRPAAERRIEGPVQVLAMEGSVGVANGDASVGLRAILMHETDGGIETFGGEIIAARVVAFEAFVTSFEDLTLVRAFDPNAGVWLFAEGTSLSTSLASSQTSSLAASQTPSLSSSLSSLQTPSLSSSLSSWHASAQPHSLSSPTSSGPPAGWVDAMAVSASAPKDRAAPPRSYPNTTGTAVMPPRPLRPEVAYADDGPLPETGDTVEHFAFGMCDVIKSDGERLHLRVQKDGRVKEIALEMLRVTLLSAAAGETEGEARRYRLDRRL